MMQATARGFDARKRVAVRWSKLRTANLARPLYRRLSDADESIGADANDATGGGKTAKEDMELWEIVRAKRKAATAAAAEEGRVKLEAALQQALTMHYVDAHAMLAKAIHHATVETHHVSTYSSTYRVAAEKLEQYRKQMADDNVRDTMREVCEHPIVMEDLGGSPTNSSNGKAGSGDEIARLTREHDTAGLHNIINTATSLSARLARALENADSAGLNTRSSKYAQLRSMMNRLAQKLSLIHI